MTDLSALEVDARSLRRSIEVFVRERAIMVNALQAARTCIDLYVANPTVTVQHTRRLIDAALEMEEEKSDA